MELSIHNSVAILAFSPSTGYPRLTLLVLQRMSNLLDKVLAASVFTGVVIAANDRSFATGADIEQVSAVKGIRAWEFAGRGQSICRRIASFPLPVVAAIRGYCLGGGLDRHMLRAAGRTASRTW